MAAYAAQLPADGRYTVEVTLSGGSGRATVESPAEVTVLDGSITAIIVWNSPYYDLMTVDNMDYYPINAEGNSAFEIPVSAIGEDIAVSAETVAMSTPHVIDYTLHFNADSITPLDNHGESGLTPVAKLLIAAVIIAGLVLAVFLAARQRRKVEEDAR